MNASKRTGPYVYKPPPDEALPRRLRAYEFDVAIRRAYKGETRELAEYLRSDLPLTEERRESLADLIERRLQRKGRGRPRGPIPNPRDDAMRLWIWLARKQLNKIRERSPNHRLPKGTIDKVIDWADDLLAVTGDLHPVRNRQGYRPRRAATRSQDPE